MGLFSKQTKSDSDIQQQLETAKRDIKELKEILNPPKIEYVDVNELIENNEDQENTGRV